MCGVAGIKSFSNYVDNHQLEMMIHKLRHRGPDGTGTWLNNDRLLGLAHARLSILELSDLGKQPMHYLNERYTITFNGEIYNYLEIKGSLEKRGYSFRSNSDTEVLLALYDLKKEKALDELDGMFAFAIWDEKEKLLFCARDRFGEKPFFYTHNKEFFAFASEMKALFSLGIDRTSNKEKVYNYMLYNLVENPNNKESTFYENIKQLEPSTYLIIGSDDRIIKKQYWSLNKGSQLLANSEKELEEKFKELLTLSVKRRLRSDVPVGSSLSGGLDSSSIVMLIDSLKPNNSIQKTFSARFKDFIRDEGKFMQMIIDKANVEPHFVFPTFDSVLENLNDIFYYQEEPFGSLSIAIQFEVMKLAKQNGVTVLLDGQGADEVLAGYGVYWESYFAQLYKTNKASYAREKLSYFSNHDKLPVEESLIFKWKAIHKESLQKFSQLQRVLKSRTSDYYLGIHPDYVSKFSRKENPIPKMSSLKEHLAYSLMHRGLNELLRYSDRNAMANSVEVRLPFLNHELVEFVFTLPDKMLLQGGWTKYILRQSMQDVLPSEITWRKDKIGFEPPQEDWMKTKAFKDLLNESIKNLKKEKVIIKENPSLAWNYISLYFLNTQKA